MRDEGSLNLHRSIPVSIFVRQVLHCLLLAYFIEHLCNKYWQLMEDDVMCRIVFIQLWFGFDVLLECGPSGVDMEWTDSLSNL